MLFVHEKTAALGLAILLMLSASGMEARAQRTMKGESLVSAGVHYPFSNPYWMGVDFSYGQYLLGSYWKAGVCATEYTYQLAEDIPMGYLHAAAFGDWMYRFIGTRNRIVSLYGGPGFFLGYEMPDAWGLIPDSYKGDYSKGYFLYGIRLSLEMEVFLSKRVALTLGGSLPINFSSPFGKFHCQAGAGIRINI